MNGTELAFWGAVALLVYTYAGYPCLLWAWARLAPREVRLAPVAPRMTVVVVAYNEASRILARIDNLLAAAYDPAALDVIVASDGSTDDTAARARSHRSPRVKVIEFRLRRGKSAVLNDVVPFATGEIVVLTDARQRFDRDTLRALAADFADPRVGAVGGELVLEPGDGSEVGEGVGFYWRYETFIRRCEGLVDSMVGATGAVYAVRRELYRMLPETTILDDVLVPMNVARRGYRVVFEPRARAYDRMSGSAHAEFGRKVRTLAGNFQLFAMEHWLLNPFANRLWLQTVSHKACRLLGPLCLAAALVTSALLLHLPLYRWLFAAQLALYAAAAAGGLMRRSRRLPAALNVPFTFCLLNWATVVGLVRFLDGRQRVTWERTSG